MSYSIREVELSASIGLAELDTGGSALALVGRLEDELIGFALIKRSRDAWSSDAELRRVLDERFGAAVTRARARREFGTTVAKTEPLPSLTVAICTKDRAVRLSRLLQSLIAVPNVPFPRSEILVIDNASVDGSTRAAVEQVAGVRYVREERAGLDFARNAALREAAGDLIAFLDDDVVVDRGWYDGLDRAWRSLPTAGGFTGLVMPYRLDTPAQCYFEEHGGFGRGFERREFHAASFDYPLHPSGAGLLGAGCNMAFDRRHLIALGGFDEALDTGRPLPGGGDLDIFYRVLRSGRAMVYEPSYAVYHEHRETLAELRRQYWSWGLGMLAFLDKCGHADPSNAGQLRAMKRWWLLDQSRRVGRAAMRARSRELDFALAEFWGGLQALAGEYDKSRRRVGVIRSRAS